MPNLHIIHEEPGLLIRAMQVPGGVLLVTDSYQESGNGITTGVASSFVPMTGPDAVRFLRGEDTP